jgi:hypothetical protein
MGRRDGLPHPRDERSTLQVFGDVGGCSVCVGLRPVALVAPEAFPGPVPCDKRAQIIIAFNGGRPGRSGGAV